MIEKHGKAQGLEIKVHWLPLSGGAAVNDALLTCPSTSPAPGLARC